MSSEGVVKFDGGAVEIEAVKARMDFAFAGVKQVVEGVMRDHAELDWQFRRLQAHCAALAAENEALIAQAAQAQERGGIIEAFQNAIAGGTRQVYAHEPLTEACDAVAEWRRRALDAEGRLARMTSVLERG